MVNWLDRARREILEKADLSTAITAKRNLTAVLAVPHLGKSGISPFSNGGNGGALESGFRKIESQKMAFDTFYPVSPKSNSVRQQAESEIPKSVGLGTSITDEINLTSVKMTPSSEKAMDGDNCLPYPERRALYARLNGLYHHLRNRLNKFGMELEIDLAALIALDAWASDVAILDLYAGRVSWTKERRRIYQWAKAELASIRSQREYNVGGKHHAE